MTDTVKYIPSLKLGDVNADQMIDARDASDILAYYANISSNKPTGVFYKGSADVNEDKVIDARDASDILSYYAFTSTGNNISLTTFIASKEK